MADYIGGPITFTSYRDRPAIQVDLPGICVQAQAFKIGDGSEPRASRLKIGAAVQAAHDRRHPLAPSCRP